MPATQTTTLGRKWLLKMVVFLVVCLGLGIWGVYDAAIAYPRRGAKAAERAEFAYLDALTDRGKRAAMVSFEPVPEFERLRAAVRAGAASDLDRAKHSWLEQLSIIGKLDAAHTQIPDAVARYQQLRARWLNSAGQPAPAPPLSWYDIWVQWAIGALGFGLALWLLIRVARVARSRYSWDPHEKRLFLPDGSSLVPADIAEFDKRKWDKFLIYLRVRPSHDRHAGKELLLDLYHHHPLEEWVLEMERIAFPDTAPPVTASGSEAKAAESAPTTA